MVDTSMPFSQAELRKVFRDRDKYKDENEKLRAAMKQAAEWLEWVDSFPLPLDARRKLNETEGLLLNGGDEALRELQRLGQEWDNDDAEQRQGASVADQRHEVMMGDYQIEGKEPLFRPLDARDIPKLEAEIESLRVKMTKDNVKLAKQRDYYHDAWKEAQKEIERMREESTQHFEGKG